MPMYSYKCGSCGSRRELLTTIEDRNNPVKCRYCHGAMKLKIVPPMIAPVLGGSSMPGYECPVTGEYVTSRKRRRDIMKEHDLVEAG